MSNKLTVGSLFSGIGGMDLGLERAGMEIKWMVEIDGYCQKVLAKHWPDVPKFGDIKECGSNNLEVVDVVAGGFPCQPFSTAGDQAGEGHDSYLWPEMLRVIKELRPAWVIGENVSAIDGMVLDEMVSDLEANEYEVAPPFEIPACSLGYDHRRYRHWILGHTNSHREPGSPVNAEVAMLPGNHCVAGGMGKAHGPARRMDRIRGCGNAVIPDFPEFIGRLIMDAERGEKSCQGK